MLVRRYQLLHPGLLSHQSVIGVLKVLHCLSVGNIPDELIEKYADEMLKKRENVEPLVEAAIDRKLAVALKEVVKLDTKEISLEDFNKMLEA